MASWPSGRKVAWPAGRWPGAGPAAGRRRARSRGSRRRRRPAASLSTPWARMPSMRLPAVRVRSMPRPDRPPWWPRRRPAASSSHAGGGCVALGLEDHGEVLAAKRTRGLLGPPGARGRPGARPASPRGRPRGRGRRSASSRPSRQVAEDPLRRQPVLRPAAGWRPPRCGSSAWCARRPGAGTVSRTAGSTPGEALAPAPRPGAGRAPGRRSICMRPAVTMYWPT